MMRTCLIVVGMAAILATGCGDDGSDDGSGGNAASNTAASSGGAGGSTSSGSGGGGAPDVPTNAAALKGWLVAGNYLSWQAESAPHDSAGPHFGTVHAYLNAPLFDSLMAQNAAHPQGAAAVKELYGNGNTVLGWSVSVKTAASSDGGQGWYWYEVYNDQVFGDGNGDGTCVGCHSSGADYVRTPFPLQ